MQKMEKIEYKQFYDARFCSPDELILLNDIHLMQQKLLIAGIKDDLVLTISIDYLKQLGFGSTYMQFSKGSKYAMPKIFGMEIIPTDFKGILSVGIKR